MPVERHPVGEIRNAVLITVDTLRADFLEPGRAETPHLARLAARGQVFVQAYAHNVMTLPSHANILTGRYPFDHGVRDNSGFVLGPSVPTLAELLSDQGLATGAFVAAFPLDARFGLGRGFEVYDDSYPEGAGADEITMGERPGEEVVRAALEWWRSREGSNRFLWLHLYEPHAPYRPPADLVESYADRPYWGEVAAVDRILEPLLRELETGPTIVILTSDHGEALGSHGEKTHGLFAYEPTLRVPLIVAAPGLPAGPRPDLARHVDLAPTILDALGAPVPPGLPGRSLLEEIPPGVGDSYFEALSPALNRGWAPLRGVVAGGVKLIDLPVRELYRLEDDPGEIENLFARERAEAARLAALMPPASAWPPPEGRSLTVEETRRLESLGYLAASPAAKDGYTEADDPKNLVHLDRAIHDAIDLYHRGRLEEAEAAAASVVAARPDMGIAHYYLAQIQLESGQVRAALDTMSRAHRSGVATLALSRQLALTLAEVGRPEDGVAILEPLAEARDPDVLNTLGLVLSEAGRQSEARQILESVFELDRRHPAAHETLALVAMRTGNWPEAERQARAALALNDDLPLAWNYLAVARYQQGSIQEALDAWQAAAERDPGNLDVLFNLAAMGSRHGRPDLARQAAERYLAQADPQRYAEEVATLRQLMTRLPGF